MSSPRCGLLRVETVAFMLPVSLYLMLLRLDASSLSQKRAWTAEELDVGIGIFERAP